MAKKKIFPELQEAILALPSKEKNKLLIRLINKDELLVEQLQFKLLENTDSDLSFRIAQIKEEIDISFKQNISYYKDLLSFTRDKITAINRFQKITKDKRGELELLVYIYSKIRTAKIKNTLKDFHFKLKFKDYSLLRLKKMNTLLDGLHEDYRIEFEEELFEITTYINEL